MALLLGLDAGHWVAVAALGVLFAAFGWTATDTSER